MTFTSDHVLLLRSLTVMAFNDIKLVSSRTVLFMLMFLLRPDHIDFTITSHKPHVSQQVKITDMDELHIGYFVPYDKDEKLIDGKKTLRS